jgi:hypothetical protein
MWNKHKFIKVQIACTLILSSLCFDVAFAESPVSDNNISSAPPPAYEEERPAPPELPSKKSPVKIQAAHSYLINDPSDEEQMFLEYINRARANPAAHSGPECFGSLLW